MWDILMQNKPNDKGFKAATNTTVVSKYGTLYVEILNSKTSNIDFFLSKALWNKVVHHNCTDNEYFWTC